MQVCPIWGARPFSKHPETRIETMDYQMRSTKRTCPPIPPRLPRSQGLFMQNKPNFQEAKMNLTTYGHKNYQNTHPRSPLQNKPNFTPTPDSTQASIKMQNKPNLPGVKMNLTTYCSTPYESISLPMHRKNKPNFSLTVFCSKRLELFRMGATMEKQTVGTEENPPTNSYNSPGLLRMC